MSEEVQQPEEPDFYDDVDIPENAKPDYEAEEVEQENADKAPPQEEKE